MSSLVLVGIGLFLLLLWFIIDTEAKTSVDEMEFIPPCPEGLCEGDGILHYDDGTENARDEKCPCSL